MDKLLLSVSTFLSFLISTVTAIIKGLNAIAYILPLICIYFIGIWVGYLYGAINQDNTIHRVRGWVVLLSSLITFLFIYLVPIFTFLLPSSWKWTGGLVLLLLPLIAVYGLKPFLPDKIIKWFEESLTFIEFTHGARKEIERTCFYSSSVGYGFANLTYYLQFSFLPLYFTLSIQIPLLYAFLWAFYRGEKSIRYSIKSMTPIECTRGTVRNEVRQIEGGSTAQNKLRRVYQSFRFRSLLTDSPLYPFDTKEETLLAAIRQVKQEYPDFEPGFNEDFFNLETGETKQNEPREEEKE